MIIFKNNIMKFIFIFLLSFLLMACSDEKPIKSNNAKYLESGSKIMAIGDSLTFGEGANKNESYPAHLEKIAKEKNNIRVINEGVSGFTTEDLKERISGLIEKNQPQLILMNIGGNDFLRKTDISETDENLRYIIDTIKAKRIPLVMIAEPKPSVGGLITGLEDHEIYIELSDKYKIPLISNVFSEYLSESKYKSDLIHLNSAGYLEVAKEVYKELVLQQFLY